MVTCVAAGSADGRHLGQAPVRSHGFDSNLCGSECGNPQCNSNTHSPYTAPYGPNFRACLPHQTKGDYLTDRLVNESAGILQQLGAQPKSFLLVHAFYSVHKVYDSPPQLVDKYESKAHNVTDSKHWHNGVRGWQSACDRKQPGQGKCPKMGHNQVRVAGEFAQRHPPRAAPCAHACVLCTHTP